MGLENIDGIGRKGIYLEISKDYYDAINRCDKAARLRMEYDKALKEEWKTLKRKLSLLESRNDISRFFCFKLLIIYK